MLILTRQPGQTIRIGDEIAVTILGTNGRQVRIGIAAPKAVAVNRLEVYERIGQERSGDQPERRDDGPYEPPSQPLPTVRVKRRR